MPQHQAEIAFKTVLLVLALLKSQTTRSYLNSMRLYQVEVANFPRRSSRLDACGLTNDNEAFSEVNEITPSSSFNEDSSPRLSHPIDKGTCRIVCDEEALEANDVPPSTSSAEEDIMNDDKTELL